MFIILILAVVSQVYTYVKTHRIAHFKYVQLFISQLYLNRAIKKQKNQKEGEVREKMGMCFQRQNRLNIEDHRH